MSTEENNLNVWVKWFFFPFWDVQGFPNQLTLKSWEIYSQFSNALNRVCLQKPSTIPSAVREREATRQEQFMHSVSWRCFIFKEARLSSADRQLALDWNLQGATQTTPQVWVGVLVPLVGTSFLPAASWALQKSSAPGRTASASAPSLTCSVYILLSSSLPREAPEELPGFCMCGWAASCIC